MDGRPYTPQVWEYNPDTHEDEWVEGKHNSMRYPPYRRLDIRLDNRYFLRKWTVVVFVEIQNLLNHHNVAYYFYPEDEPEREVVKQWGFFPVGGVRLDF